MPLPSRNLLLRATLPTALALVACNPGDPAAEADTGTAAAPTDLRRTFPDPPDSDAEMLVFEPPAYTIPAFGEKQFCWFGTYDGPEVGIVYNAMFQAPSGHHVVMLTTTADPDVYPDGEVFDCTGKDALPMTDMDPNFIGSGELVDTGAGPQGEFWLPEGMGAVMKPGTRYVIQSHYVNYEPEDILVNDRMVYGVLPADQIETWAAPVIHVKSDMAIPPGQETRLSFECAFEQDVNILFLGGHMHEYGTAFSLDHLKGDGSETLLYDIPVWDPYMRDAPPFNRYLDAPLAVAAGDRWRTSCTWFNTEDHALEFPSEMCVTFGMAYPARVSITCDSTGG